MAGVLLIIYRTEFWSITKVHMAVVGVLLVLTGVMMIPGFLYRLFKNTEK